MAERGDRERLRHGASYVHDSALVHFGDAPGHTLVGEPAPADCFTSALLLYDLYCYIVYDLLLYEWWTVPTY